MSCYRKLMRSTQRTFLTSAFGLALWFPATPGLAQEPPKSAVQQQLEELYMRDGRELPDMVIPHYEAPPEVQATAGSRSRPGGSRGVLDRVFGIFRRDRAPSSPPRDPGMSQPPSRRQQATPQQPQQARTPRSNNFVPPPVPGSSEEQPSLRPATPRGDRGESLSAQPGRFQPPASANPIQQPKMTPQPAPAEVAQPETKIQPKQTAERPEAAPSQAQRAPETAAVPPAPAGNPQDPFDNLFPEEPEEIADANLGQLAEVPPPVTDAPQDDAPEPKQPYTGLKLEEDLFSNTGPDPMAEQRERESREWDRRQQEQAASEKDQFAAVDTARQREAERPSQTEKPRSIEVPPVDELPQLSESPRLKQAPAPPVEELEKTSPQSRPDDKRSKMERIAARKGRSGLKGFCPVALRDRRELVDASDDYAAVFNGKLYHLSSESAMEKFLNDPAMYAPAARGADVIHLALTGGELEGSLDYAVWYKGRLYLFAGVETMETFVAAPSSHATNQ
jgi:YHS domain-containing protein